MGNMRMQIVYDIESGRDVCHYEILRHDLDDVAGLRAFSMTFSADKSRHDIANALWHELRQAAKGLRPARRR